MTTILDRLNRLADRQEALIQAINRHTDCIGILDAKLTELLEWANKPLSSALEEALQDTAAALTAMDKQLATLPEQVAARLR